MRGPEPLHQRECKDPGIRPVAVAILLRVSDLAVLGDDVAALIEEHLVLSSRPTKDGVRTAHTFLHVYEVVALITVDEVGVSISGAVLDGVVALIAVYLVALSAATYDVVALYTGYSARVGRSGCRIVLSGSYSIARAA